MIPEPEFRTLEQQLKDERIAYKSLAESYEKLRLAVKGCVENGGCMHGHSGPCDLLDYLESK